MASEYVNQSYKRAFESITEMKKSGKEPVALELSSDVWTFINMGGISMSPGELSFAGLEVIIREDLENHIQAI